MPQIVVSLSGKVLVRASWPPLLEHTSTLPVVMAERRKVQQTAAFLLQLAQKLHDDDEQQLRFP